MNANKIANKFHAEIASLTSRGTSKHGLKKGLIRDRRALNRRAKRCDSALHFASQEARNPSPSRQETRSDEQSRDLDNLNEENLFLRDLAYMQIYHWKNDPTFDEV